jgi:topoisomerase-4 subunit B
MNAEQLWDTTLNPDTRRLLRVDVADAQAAATVLTQLMGRNEAAARRELMERLGDAVEVDI